MGARLSSAARTFVAILAVAAVMGTAACTSEGGADATGDTSVTGMTSSAGGGAPGSPADAAPAKGGTAAPEETATGGADGQAAEDVAVSLPIAGLYGVERLSPRVNGKSVGFTATGSCADVLSLIDAGQWSTTVLTTPDDFAGPAGDLAPWYLVILSKGGQRAYLRLAEGEYTCDAVLIPESAETVALAGAQTASGPAMLQPFQCGPNMFDRESMQLIGFYSVPGDRQILVTVDLPAEEGESEIERDGSEPVVTLLPEGRSGLEVMAEGMAQSLKTGEDAVAVGSQEFVMTEESTAAVTISSLYPLEGEFRITGLADGGGANLDVTASFYCDTTPMPEETGDGSDGSGSDDDGGSGDGAGKQGTVTVDVASGPLQGTYTASGKLSCDYGFTAPHAWWLYFTAMDANGDLPDDPAPTDLTVMQWWSVLPEEASAPGVLFSDPVILDLGFGQFVLDRSLQLHVNSDVGGSGGEVQRDGNVVTVSATTAEGPAVTVTAQCPVIEEG